MLPNFGCRLTKSELSFSIIFHHFHGYFELIWRCYRRSPVAYWSLFTINVIHMCVYDNWYTVLLNLHFMITDDWSLGYTSVRGDENIVIGGQRLSTIYAPVFFTCIILVWFEISFLDLMFYQNLKILFKMHEWDNGTPTILTLPNKLSQKICMRCT